MNEGYFFTEFLEDTKNKVKGKFSTGKWLKTIDNDSLLMLQGYIHNFETSCDPEDINEEEAADMLMLVKTLNTLEGGKPEWASGSQPLDSLMRSFCAMIIFESLNRKGLISIIGDNKLTAKGKSVQNTQKELDKTT